MRRLRVFMTIFLAASFPLGASVKPHYTFTLPDNYIGWVEIIFGVPGTSPLPANGQSQTIRIEEDGTARTVSLRIERFSTDDFLYRRIDGHGVETLVRVPSDYVTNGTDHGGFDACCNRDSSPGSPWYFFVGPPKERGKIPFDEIRENFWKPGSVDPVPGRIKTDSPK